MNKQNIEEIKENNRIGNINKNLSIRQSFDSDLFCNFQEVSGTDNPKQESFEEIVEHTIILKKHHQFIVLRPT